MQEKNHTLVSSIDRLPNNLALVKTIKLDTRFQLAMQGSKVMVTNLQNASYFDNLRVRKISTCKPFASENHADLPNIWNEFAGGLTSLLVEKKSYWQNFACGLKSYLWFLLCNKVVNTILKKEYNKNTGSNFPLSALACKKWAWQCDRN